MVGHPVSYLDSAFSDIGLKLTMVGIFMPQKSANTANQHLIFCFVDYVDLRK